MQPVATGELSGRSNVYISSGLYTTLLCIPLRPKYNVVRLRNKYIWFRGAFMALRIK